MDDSSDPWAYNPPITAEYRDFTAFKNGRTGAIGEDVGDIRWIDFKVADHKLSGLEMTFREFSEPYTTTRFENALVIGKSGNTEDNVLGAAGIITP